MEKTKQFQELEVWKKAHQFVLGAYKYTTNFPKEERYGLVSQFRRSAVSIPANIAEGYAKYGLKDKVRFYNIAQGSLEECRYYLILSNDLDYGENMKLTADLETVSKMLTSYIKAIKNKIGSK